MNNVNYAVNLPAIDNQDLQRVLGTKVQEYIVRNYRLTLPAHLFINIDDDVELCRTVSYLCENHDDTPSMADSAVNGGMKRQTIAPPKVITFQGFCKGGFESKLSVEQLQCINESTILQQWYQSQLATAVEDGKNAIMARFYRHMMAKAHPRNQGANAGLISGGNQLGTLADPVLFDVDNADRWVMSILSTIKQMPKANPPGNEYGLSTENAYFFGHASMESVFMQVDGYNSYRIVGDCASCSLFTDVFDKMPRGVMPITSHCVEAYQCESGGATITVYPVLFGKRYMGTKASLHVKSTSYESKDAESVIYKTKFYHHIHTYDPRFIGLSYITIRDEQPATVQGCS